MAVRRCCHARVLGGQVTAAADNLDLTDEALMAQQHRATKVVERRTLKRVLPTAWSVIKNIYKPLELQVRTLCSPPPWLVVLRSRAAKGGRSGVVRGSVRACIFPAPFSSWVCVPCLGVCARACAQEPMYKEVVVLYRTSGQGRKAKQNKVPVKARSLQERLKDILERRNVHVKFFHDIPMADMEVIFPGAQRSAREGLGVHSSLALTTPLVCPRTWRLSTPTPQTRRSTSRT